MSFNHEKKENSVACDNLDKPWGHCAKFNKSDRERNSAWSHFYAESKKLNSEKQRVGLWLPGDWGGGNGEMLVKGYKLPVIRWTSSWNLM